MNTFSTTILVLAILSQAGNPQPSGASAGFPIRNGGSGSAGGAGGGSGGGAGGGSGGGGGTSGDGGSTYFTFADGTDAGLTELCACQNVSTVQGHPVTWLRSGIGAYCLKNGYTPSGITNTDAVLCDGGLPRVVLNPYGNKGVWEERASTNSLYRTQDFSHPNWSGYAAGGGGAVTVTADQATAPDGTLTADRVQVSGCSAVNSYSLLGQLLSISPNVYSAGLFIKGVSGSGQISLMIVDGNVQRGKAIQCPYNPTTWYWCGAGNNPLYFAMGSSNVQFFFGCDNQVSSTIIGATDTGAADFYAWQADLQDGFSLTSPILNVATNNTRQADDNYVELPNSQVSTTYSMSGTAYVPSYSGGAYYPTQPRWGGSWSVSPDGGYLPDGGGFIEAYPYVSSIRQASSNYSTLDYYALYSGLNRLYSRYNGSTLLSCANGFCSTVSQAMTAFPTGDTSFFHLGEGVTRGATGQQADGIITNVCFSENASFCPQ